MMILIFLTHYSVPGHESPLRYGGDVGVAFFFMLSGYVLTRKYSVRGISSWSSFMFARIVKIYPLHFFGFLAAVCFFGFWSFKVTLANILLFQSFVDGWYFSYNSVSWFLSDILFFYAVFPPLLRWTERRFAFVFWAGLFVVYIALVTFSETNLWLQYIFPPVRLLCFVAGMILARLRFVAKTGNALEITAIAVFCASYCACDFLSWRWIYDLLWWPTSALLIFAFSSNSGGILTRVLSAPVLTKFGDLSFSFYIVHQLVIRIYNARLSAAFDIGILSLPLIFAVSALSAWLLNRFVAKPSSSYLLKFNRIRK